MRAPTRNSQLTQQVGECRHGNLPVDRVPKRPPNSMPMMARRHWRAGISLVGVALAMGRIVHCPSGPISCDDFDGSDRHGRVRPS